MKKIIIATIFTAMMCLPVHAEELKSLEVIKGSADNYLSENFSSVNQAGSPVFKGISIFKNDLSKTAPGWGLIGESSEISGINVSDLGKKEYVIPVSEGQLSEDIGVKISTTEEGVKPTYLDVWNIPLANIAGSSKYRFEYNVYINCEEKSNRNDFITDFRFYATDVPGAEKNVGVIGFKHNGNVSGISNLQNKSYYDIKDESGNNVKYKNKAWNHVVLEFDAEKSTFDFCLNGTELLKSKALGSPVLFNASSGTYRVRLCFTPQASEPDNFVVFDDVMFAKYKNGGTNPVFYEITSKNGEKFIDKTAFSALTKEVTFENVANVNKNNTKVLKNGKEVDYNFSVSGGLCKIALKDNIEQGAEYIVKFNRFACGKDNIYPIEDAEFKFYARKIQASDIAIEKNGSKISSLSALDSTCVAKASLSGNGTTAILTVVQYNSDGMVKKIWTSEKITTSSEKTTLKVTLDGAESAAGEEIKLLIVESEENLVPLWKAVSVK